MSKLTVKEKIEIYEKRQQGITISSLSQKYNVHGENLKYLICLIKRHGYGVVERKNNRYYSPDLKEEESTTEEKVSVVSELQQN
ncbi:hypothetical protein AwErysi_01850 [Erysipelotrichaceae bacterium]|nr:hypothetical protein AwErysi_01850 [Erysipelotrichaceae bacterium]